MYTYTECGIAVAYTRSEHPDFIDIFEFVHEYEDAALIGKSFRERQKVLCQMQ